MEHEFKIEEGKTFPDTCLKCGKDLESKEVYTCSEKCEIELIKEFQDEEKAQRKEDELENLRRLTEGLGNYKEV